MAQSSVKLACAVAHRQYVQVGVARKPDTRDVDAPADVQCADAGQVTQPLIQHCQSLSRKHK